MKSTVIWALVLLNAVLLGSFVERLTRQNSALAQPVPNNRRPGDYLMIPADVNGSSNGIIVVVDQANGQLSAVSYDDSNRRFDTMTKIDLMSLFHPPAPPPAQRPR
ncbi:MAG TPA: hypothetical protein VKK61_06625 [Tepidisphaeraceae bacterium]|nr:hypothetical protein [Tepidisphaeraceae bacterium]